ncbi:MAG: putative spermidine/putrescine transport system permease protein [Thermoleophilaceae bacterium]|jgi:ABC-type spermidine/putrescine transport system permease subunit II|nr:putative spermidine/putrescine transport system permease protein [Thermoleophilaceae bacterium]MEA2401651.1 putative spermidine/putrescine transport system permease protein [Thermoleophilaceae bacterium]MEA2456073.1 putative spermidine/putrescine transport system permease protein [Thermoleophilaceae bacterium]
MTTGAANQLTFGRGRRLGTRVALRLGSVVTAIIVVVLLAPVLTVIAVSFSQAEFFEFPPKALGFRQYDTLFSDTDWLKAVGLSFRIAIPAALISALISVPTVLAIYRSSLRGRQALQFTSMLSLIIPISAYAVAMYGVFAQFQLVGTYIGLVIANTVLAFPLTLAVVAAAMSRVPQELELAAMIAGASRARAWMQITGRLLLPALLGGTLLAFIASFDEAVMINFVGGAGQITLPKAIFDSVRYGVDPVITAIATLLMVGTGVLMFAIVRLRGAGNPEGGS